MKLGMMVNYAGRQINLPMDLIKKAEALGFDSVWTAETYGGDAISSSAWILANTDTIKVGTAIMQMPSRSPALCAMSAMSLNQLSNGRFKVGLGASGPQVVEGWHGVPYGKPISRQREYVQIMRKIMAREERVTFEGKQYQLPYTGPGATGLGKPLKSILEADNSIPIYTASITPAGLACSAEVADGVFPIWLDPNKFDVIGKHLQTGFDRVPGKSLANFDVAPFITTIMGDDIDWCRSFVRCQLALYIGGMGAKGKNFYTQYTTDMGYGADAEKIQDLYLAGNKQEAEAAVPVDLIDAISLLGPKERIIDQLADWKASERRGEVRTMLLGTLQEEVLELMAEQML